MKLYKESEIPEGAKVLYLCRHKCGNGPCPLSQFSAACSPDCWHTKDKAHAKQGNERRFYLERDTYIETNGLGSFRADEGC